MARRPNPLNPILAHALGGAVGGAASQFVSKALMNPPETTDTQIRRLERAVAADPMDLDSWENLIRVQSRVGRTLTTYWAQFVEALREGRVLHKSAKDTIVVYRHAPTSLASGNLSGLVSRLRSDGTEVVDSWVYYPHTKKIAYDYPEHLPADLKAKVSRLVHAYVRALSKRLRQTNPHLALIGVGAANPRPRTRPAPSRRRANPALALIGVGALNPPPPKRAQNPTNHANKRDKGFKGYISIAEAKAIARARGKLKVFEKAIRDCTRFHGSPPKRVAVWRYDDKSPETYAVFGHVVGRADHVFYCDVPEGSNKHGKLWDHETAKNAKPTYVRDSATDRLVLVGGAMRVTNWLHD